MRGSLALAVLLLAPGAWAQRGGRGGSGGRTNQQTQTLQPQQQGSGSGTTVHGGAGGGSGTLTIDKTRNTAADAARAKALAGDCKGALDLFDEALRHSVDPTLYRDRGLCHEKLGNVYPAIDDYRVYLSQAPDAADAAKYRERLDSLVAGASQDIAPETGLGGDFDAEMRGGMTDGSTPVSDADLKKRREKEDEAKAAKVDDPNAPLSQVEYEETRDREARNGALRSGKGFVLGAYFYPRYVFNKYDFQYGQSFGAKLGYSFNDSSTLFVELGYVQQLSTGTDAATGGLAATFGYELRVPFDRWASNQLVASIAAGYEGGNDSIGDVYASFVARGRAGYRHVFGPGFALDFMADGGMLATFLLQAPGPTPSPIGAFIGGVVAVSVGF